MKPAIKTAVARPPTIAPTIKDAMIRATIIGVLS